jgi:lysophospholipase L1-like esterase
VIGKRYSSYVAIGDSLSEGLGDFTFKIDRNHNGWTDRLAGILARESADSGFEFQYANLALRGSKLESIMESQLQQALNLQPDLVTVMAGSNNLTANQDHLPKLKGIFRDGIQQLLAAGCDVVVANTINPLHLRVFKPLRSKALRFSEMIEDVAADFEIPVLDIYGIKNFEQLRFWAEDMVHFSGHGHIVVANRAAELIDLKYRYPETCFEGMPPVTRGFLETATWVARDVIPYAARKITGVTSGDGMDPKQLRLEAYKPTIQHPAWQLLSQ